MANGYMPRRDLAALSWMQNFSRHLMLQPAAFAISISDAVAIGRAVDDFAVAYAVITNPATRTPVAVLVKDQARNSADAICRVYYNLIKPNQGISDADKIAIGVRPINLSRARIGEPTTSPLLKLIGATPASHTLYYSDTNTPDRSAKAFGATHLQLFVALGESPARDVNSGRYYQSFTRNPMSVGFAHADDGKVATYWGRWMTRKGEVGPWSLPTTMRVAA